MFKHAAAALSLAASIAMPAFADDLPEPVARALEASVEDGDRSDWRFVMTIVTSEGEVRGRYDGAADEAEQWTLVSPSDEAMTEGQRAIWDDIIEPDEDATEEGSGLFFGAGDLSFHPGSMAALDDASGLRYAFAPRADDEEMVEFEPYLSGELTLSEDMPQIGTIRIYATESFKPNFAVRINTFELVQEYAPMEGLPAPVMRRMSQRISGSAAFQTFTEEVDILFSDIEFLRR